MRYGLPKFSDFWDPSTHDQDPSSRDQLASSHDTTRRRATGSTVDLGLTRQLHISYQVRLSKLKKKLVKIFLHANVCLKWTDRQVCPSVRVLNGHLNLQFHPVRQSCSEKGIGLLKRSNTGGPASRGALASS